MFNTVRKALLAGLFAGMAGPVFAADLVEPSVVEQAPPAVYEQPADVGAGIGGARVKWDDVRDPNTTEFNPGVSSWRFAYALMAGASYCLTDKLILDAGYRFSHIQGGRMFEWDASSSGPGFDRGINTHEVRGGLRYQFGGNNGCAAPVVAYQPEPEPVYTK